MRVLCTYPFFRETEGIVEKQLIELGIDAVGIPFSIGIESKNFYQKLRYLLRRDLTKYYKKKRITYNNNLLNTVNTFKPDLVYIRQGSEVLPDTLKQISEITYVALALSDILSLFPAVYDLFPFCDVIYSYDKQDIETLRQKGFNAKFEPARYESSVYYKLGTKKTTDISFVGAMYPERIEIMKRLANTFPTLNWEIYGKYAPPWQVPKWIKWLKNKEYRYFKNKEISKYTVNSVYNRSRIVLNIVRANQRDGWSSRLPQILGTGSFQITNYYESVEREFGDCLCTYTDFDDLVEKIKYYLEHDEERKSIAERGYQKAIECYADEIASRLLLKDFASSRNKQLEEIITHV